MLHGAPHSDLLQVNAIWASVLFPRAKFQGQETKGTKAQELACEQSRRAVDVPAVGKPVAEPEPSAAVPVEAADAQAATRVAVDCTPEKDVAGATLGVHLPFLGNEVRMGEEIVEHVGVEHGLRSELAAELIALDDSVTNLVRGEIEVDLGLVPRQLATLAVLFHFPAVGREGVGVAVDEMTNDRDFATASDEREKLTELVLAVRESCEIFGFPPHLAGSNGELVYKSYADVRRCSHGYSSFLGCDTSLEKLGTHRVDRAVAHHGLGLAECFATAENVLKIRHFLL